VLAVADSLGAYVERLQARPLWNLWLVVWTALVAAGGFFIPRWIGRWDEGRKESRQRERAASERANDAEAASVELITAVAMTCPSLYVFLEKVGEGRGATLEDLQAFMRKVRTVEELRAQLAGRTDMATLARIGRWSMAAHELEAHAGMLWERNIFDTGVRWDEPMGLVMRDRLYVVRRRGVAGFGKDVAEAALEVLDVTLKGTAGADLEKAKTHCLASAVAWARVQFELAALDRRGQEIVTRKIAEDQAEELRQTGPSAGSTESHSPQPPQPPKSPA
jgi:hypothetical protein